MKNAISKVYPDFHEVYKKLLKDQADARKSIRKGSELYTKLTDFIVNNVAQHNVDIQLKPSYINVIFKAHENDVLAQYTDAVRAIRSFLLPENEGQTSLNWSSWSNRYDHTIESDITVFIHVELPKEGIRDVAIRHEIRTTSHTEHIAIKLETSRPIDWADTYEVKYVSSEVIPF
jgi:hypothetical protein